MFSFQKPKTAVFKSFSSVISLGSNFKLTLLIARFVSFMSTTDTLSYHAGGHFFFKTMEMSPYIYLSKPIIRI